MNMSEDKKILIVDDAKFTRTMLKNIIKKIKNVEVCGEAGNGDEGVKQYKKLNPDLVTMDLVMPEKGGIETIEEIIGFDKNAKIIVVSALGQETLVLEAAKKGAKDFIVKPFKEEQVLDVVQRTLGSKSKK